MLIEPGRLIRVVSRDTRTIIAYVVAVAEPSRAVAVIREKVATPEDEVADLGRVSGSLVSSLKLRPENFLVATNSHRGHTGLGTCT